MKRDTRSAYRARQKATNDSVTAAVLEMREVMKARGEAAKQARVAAEAARVRFTRDDLKDAVVVKDRFGWAKVVSVNEFTVTVEADFGVRRIQFERVLDYRNPTVTS